MPDDLTPPAGRDEISLVRAIARGDEQAMVLLHRAHADALFRFVYRRVDESYEDCEEVIQDTFLSVIDLAPTFGGQSSVRTWLCGIARLRTIDLQRRRARSKRAPSKLQVDMHEDMPAADTPATVVDDQLAAAAIVDRLAEVLSKEEGEAFMMRHVDEFSLEEIAVLLGRSLRATEGLVYRAKQKLRQAVLDGKVEAQLRP